MQVFIELRQHQRPLHTRHHHLTAELTQLTAKREALLRQGRAADSTAKQRALARQVQTTQREIIGLRQRLLLIEKQLDLLNRLLLAQEMAHLLTAAQRHSFCSQLDWDTAPDAAHLEKLASVVQRLEAAVIAQLPPTPAGSQSATQAPQPPISSLPSPVSALVARVIDGDTILIAGGERVRYIGINCPELCGWNGEPEPFAELAAARNRQLVEGKRVRLEKDVSQQDRFGRLLRYVYVGNCLINAQLLREGLAHTLPLPPDLAQAARFTRLEAAAQRQQRGMWRNQPPVTPHHQPATNEKSQ